MHLTKGTTEKERLLNSANSIQRCMIVGTKQQMVIGWNKCSKGRCFRGSLSIGTVPNQVENGTLQIRTFADREDEFSSDISENIGGLQQNNFAGVLTLILFNRSPAQFQFSRDIKLELGFSRHAIDYDFTSVGKLG